MWWYPLAFSPVLFFGWPVVHEGSHTIAYEANGIEVVEFAPYIHRHNDRIYFGRVGLDRKPVNAPWREIGLAPYLTDMAVFASCYLALRLARSEVAKWLLITLMIAPVIDMAVGIIAYANRNNPESDLDLAGDEAAAFVIATDVLCLSLLVYEIVRTVRNRRR